MAGPATGLAAGDIVRDVIAEVAPAELPIVDGLRQLDPRTVRRRLRRRRRPRDPVAFGLEQVAALMTPVAWIVVDEVTRRLTEDAADSFGSRLARALRTAIRWLLRRPAPPAGDASAVLAPLTPAQLTAVRHRIIELGPRHHLTAADAEILADRVVARLALPAGTVAGTLAGTVSGTVAGTLADGAVLDAREAPDPPPDAPGQEPPAGAAPDPGPGPGPAAPDTAR